jgi:hypothetical protein
MATSSSYSRASSYERISIDDDEMFLDDVSITEIEEDMDKKPITFEIENDLEQPPPTMNSSNSIQQQQKRNSPPSNYICPLTLQLIEEPVNDGCGHCFERDTIVVWLEYHEICPFSRKPLHFEELVPAKALRGRIQQWRVDHQDYHSDNEEMISVSESDSHSQLELMLLPQERKVLQIIKLRAKDRRKRQEFTKCLWIVAGVTSLFLVVATCFALKLLDVRLRGPI